MYVFDTSPLKTLFNNYYPRRFPTLWEHFNSLVDDGQIISTREAMHEINNGQVDALREWADANKEVFETPTANEGAFVGTIYGEPHFQQNIELQKILKGGRNADPFIIAKAAVEGRAVVTMELFKPNAAKIPNICDHFKIPCMTLEQFMEKEAWEF